MQFRARIKDDENDKNIEKLLKLLSNTSVVKKNNLKIGHSCPSININGRLDGLTHHIYILGPVGTQFLDMLSRTQIELLEQEYLFKEYQRKYAPILRLTIQPFIKADTYTSAMISTQYYGELLLSRLNKPNIDIYGWSMSTSNPSLYWTKSVFLTTAMEALTHAITDFIKTVTK